MTCITDFPITPVRYYSPDWGSVVVCPPTKTALEAAPNPFSAFFDKLTPYSGIFSI